EAGVRYELLQILVVGDLGEDELAELRRLALVDLDPGDEARVGRDEGEQRRIHGSERNRGAQDQAGKQNGECAHKALCLNCTRIRRAGFRAYSTWTGSTIGMFAGGSHMVSVHAWYRTLPVKLVMPRTTPLILVVTSKSPEYTVSSWPPLTYFCT